MQAVADDVFYSIYQYLGFGLIFAVICMIALPEVEHEGLKKCLIHQWHKLRTDKITRYKFAFFTILFMVLSRTLICRNIWQCPWENIIGKWEIFTSDGTLNTEGMCDDCGRKYRIPSDSLDVDYACSERPMGTEVQHIFYGVMDCQCGNRLSYTITAVEYPEGAYDFHTCESVGCTYINEPSAEMDYYLPEPVLSIYEEILQNPGYVYNLEPCEFEELVADVFRRMGFNADVTQKTHDGGKDIVATFEMGGVLYTTYFECKRYSPDRPVGVEIVRELYAVMEMERVDKGVIVTTSHFTRGAVAEAQRLNGRIRLIDFDELCRLMQQK